jgi:dolichyl-phosphate-mannose-protein mannosyltransferase
MPAAAPLPWAHRGMLLLLAIASVAPYPYATFTPDTARDLHAALAIVDGVDYPLAGSVIGGLVHVGPLWFYVLALGVALTHSLAGASLYVGVLAALKFPLAYLTGKALGGPRTGFWVAVAAAIPGIAAVESLTWSHVNVIATAAWLTLWCAANAWRHDDPRWLLGTGAALGVALQAHPTAIVLAPLLLVQIIARRRCDTVSALALLGAVALAAAPFVPAIVDSLGRDNGETAMASAIVANVRQSGIAGAPTIIRSLLFTIPGLAAGAYLHRGGVPGAAWTIAQRLIWLIALAGALRIALRGPGATRALLALATLATLASIAFVAALRSYTPFYMATAAWTGATLAAGLGFRALADARGVLRGIAAFAATTIAVMHVALAAGAIERGREGWIRTPLASGSDLKTPPYAVREEPLFPAVTRDALGRALCAEPATVVVHGEFATALDLDFGQATMLACGRPARVQLGGGLPSATHWVGLPGHVVRALALVPVRWIGGYGVSIPEQVAGSARPHAIADGRAYPPHDFAGMPDVPLTVRFRAPADRAIVVTNPLPWYLPLSAVTLLRNGVAIAPQVASSSLRGWRCRDCGTLDAEWTLNLQTADPSWIDVVVLR